MSDKFSVAPIDLLFKRILDEEKQTNCIYGIHKDLFFTASPSDTFKMKRYGKTLETPIGVAAGPHTQMTQNIITAWLTGARYMELKTVQTLDELEVAKPCIDMEDEGYNCEWSQELRLTESFDEYLKAWIIIHALRHKFGWNTANATDEPGFIFNMSVGYNLEGILKDNVQRFLAKMKNCAKEKKEAVETLAKVYPAIKNISIPDRLSDNITLSTMHGCPPEEIEKIALYLVEEKKYHTAIKLNPTLLGPQMLRGILNDKLGFDTDVPDEAFGHDLKYPDALNIIRNLEAAAKKHNVDFGLKLTNTLESVNNRDVFPGTEKMMYMSGRALHPLSINLAAKLRDEFPHMDISFSAGADCFNIADVIACDLKPVTVCSDILKPGGYQRLPQYLVTLADSMKKAQANSIEQLTGERDKKNARLKEYAAAVMEGDTYKKDHFPGNSIKTPRRLDAFDCIKAPCITTCPTNQDVPDYMYYTSVGEYDKAFAAILSKNPLPTVTGMVCDHLCMTKCTRNNYDAPLHIRAIKRFVCENATTEPLLKCAPKNGLKAAVIGAGPSGLSCAFYLALAGTEVTVFEAKNFPGGMVSDAIPSFRLSDEDIKKDIERIEKLGVTIQYEKYVDHTLFREIAGNHDYIYTAVGAQRNTPMKIEGESLPGVMDALAFLSRVKRGERLDMGPRIAVIGGGNSAMDAARTAWRMIKEQDGEVTVLYRRTQNEMPADAEEIEAVLEEGIEIVELTSPVSIAKENGRLKTHCWKMKLGHRDHSGRRRPVRIEGADFDLIFDTVIPAIGQSVIMDFADELGKLKDNGETAAKNIFIGGDALRGAFNIITAVADGKKGALAILEAAGKGNPLDDFFKNPLQQQRQLTLADYQKKASEKLLREEPEELSLEKRRNFESVIGSFSPSQAQKEAARCLLCNDICNVCVSVCPNRANVSYTLEPAEYGTQKAVKQDGKLKIEDAAPFVIRQKYQVYNLADYCNECGNCNTFCPSGGAPYKEKPKVCITKSAFASEAVAYFIEAGKVRFKRDGNTATLQLKADHLSYTGAEGTARLDKANFKILEADVKDSQELSTKPAIEMKLLHDAFIGS